MGLLGHAGVFAEKIGHYFPTIPHDYIRLITTSSAVLCFACFGRLYGLLLLLLLLLLHGHDIYNRGNNNGSSYNFFYYYYYYYDFHNFVTGKRVNE